MQSNTIEQTESVRNVLIQTIKKLLPLAIPMAGIQLITTGGGFLCLVMLAHLGHNVLAASALIVSIQMTVVTIGMSLLLSLSVLIGRAFGAKDYMLIGSLVQQGWTFALVISVPILFLFWYLGKLLVLMGQPLSISQLVQHFFYAYSWGVIPLMLLVCNQQLCFGTQKQYLAVLTSLLGVVMLLVTAYLLIFGKVGFPALGVTGLGYAMAMQVWFAFLFSLSCFYFNKTFKPFNLFHYRINKNLKSLARLFAVGWPISVQISGEMLSFSASALMIGWLGVHALAAYQVVSQYILIIIIPIFALSQATGVRIGQAYGSKQFSEIKIIGYASLSIALTISLIAAVLFLLTPNALASLYFNTHSAINFYTLHLVVSFFTVAAFSQLFDATRNIITGALRGLLDTKFPMLISLFVIWCIGIPLGYCLAFAFHWGLLGVATGSGIGMFVGALIMMYRWHVLSKRYMSGILIVK